MKNLLSIFLVCLCCLMSSCYDDIVDESEKVIKPDPKITKVHRVKGTILGASGDPLPGVTLEISDKVAVTDAQGQFAIDQVEVSTTGSCLHTSLKGYAESCHTIFSSSSLEINSTLQMELADDVAQVDNTQGSRLSLPDGTTLTIPADAFVGEEGSQPLEVLITYTRASEGDPVTAPAQFVPIYVDEDNSTFYTSMQSMFYITARDLNGQELSINPQKPIEIELGSTGFSQDALLHFSFDRKNEKWLSGQSVERTNSSVKTSITQMGWQQIAVSQGATFVNLTFRSLNGNQPEGHLYWIDNPAVRSVIYHYGFIQYGAALCIPLPTGTEVRITSADDCGLILVNETRTLAASEEKQDLIFDVDLTNPVYSISGDIYGCDDIKYDTPVRLIIDRGIGTIDEEVVNNGEYSISIDDCINVDKAKLTVYDETNELIERISFSSFVEGSNRQDITLCGNQGTSTPLFEFRGDIHENVRALNNKEETLVIADRLMFGFDGDGVGTYTCRLISGNMGTGSVVISKYGNVGEQIVGTYTVKLLGNTDTITGKFVAERIK